MLFNSFNFFIFLAIVFTLYWFLSVYQLKWQNVFLLLASYLFYAWWDWRFLGLIFTSTIIDFFVAHRIYQCNNSTNRKLWLMVSLIFNLGMLGFFKYYNFFVDSWVIAWQTVGVSTSINSLKIILPVGISFYTFQTLSYTIDVYKFKLKPTYCLNQFMAYVAFFPQLVAGPIERATSLLPQFQRIRLFNFDFALSGFYLIIWGLFKKIVVADNCAFFVNQIFGAPSSYSSLELFCGAILFSLQIYGDFSGYSDIAIGVARLFGFSLMTNFTFPYFSRSIAEFWRRWHISLSTWFRDYLYIPLGGSSKTLFLTMRNVIIVFVISGLWHGANWTFVFWGLIHGLLFIPLLLIKRNRSYIGSLNFSVSQLPGILTTFVLVSISWIFFRADSLAIAFDYIKNIFEFADFSLGLFYQTSKMLLYTGIVIISTLVLIIFEYYALRKELTEVSLNSISAILISILIVFMGVFKNPSDFIYFQF